MHRPSTLLAAFLSLIAPSLTSFPDTSLLPRQGGCATPGFVPCNPPGSTGSLGVPPIAFNGGGSGFWSSLQSAATGWNPMLKREIEDGLMERQSGGLCCRPAPVQCLYTKDQGVPFCYVSLSISSFSLVLSSLYSLLPLRHANIHTRPRPQPASTSPTAPTPSLPTAPTTAPTAPLSTTKRDSIPSPTVPVAPLPR